MGFLGVPGVPLLLLNRVFGSTKATRTKYQPPPLPPSAGRNNFQSHILKWEGFRKKKCVWGGLKQFLPWIFA